MTHRNEDELLAYALEVVESQDELVGIAAHLESCSECRARLESIRADISAIAGVRPSGVRATILAGRRGPSRARVSGRLGLSLPGHALLRAAALIAVGVVVGFGAGSRIHREPVFVSPAYVETSAPAVPPGTAAVSDATGLAAAYYERILEQR